MFTLSDFSISSKNALSVAIRKVDRFVAINRFCKQFGKEYRNLIRASAWLEYLEGFKKTHPQVTTPIYMLKSGLPKSMSEFEGNYIHPELLDYFAIVCEPSKAFDVRELLAIALSQIDNPEPISKQIQQITQITNEQTNVGRSGEKLVFDLLKAYFPDLIDCHGTAHADDFYDPVNNIRFEVKTKVMIHTEDYKKIRYDDQLRKPRLTVLISNVDKVSTTVRLFPNILVIHIDELERDMLFWKTFIMDSEWEREEMIVDRLNCNEMHNLISQFKGVINTGATLTGGAVASTTNEAPVVKFTTVKTDVGEALTDCKASSLKAFVDYRANDFKSGVDSHHIKGSYTSFCKRNNIVMVSNQSLFAAEMNKFCISYVPKTRWNDPNKTCRPHYLSRDSELADDLMNNFIEWMDDHATSTSKAESSYEEFSKHEIAHDRIYLSRRCFFFEFKAYMMENYGQKTSPSNDVDPEESTSASS